MGPDRVRSLVLASAGAGSRKSFEEEGRPHINRLFGVMTCAFYSCCLFCCVKDPDPRSVHMVALEIEEVGVFSGEESEKVNALRVPVLCIVGEKDTVVEPETVQELKDLIPNSRYVCVEKADHLSVLKTDTFQKTVIGFIKDARG